MSNEQKLREAFELGWKMAANWSLSDHLLADMESPAYLTERDGLLQALATTEPEPTGMPEVKPWDHPEPQTMRWSDLEIRWIQSYGEQCWKSGYKHGAWGDKPAVNQQLTTEPVDEREAFEREMSCEEIWGHRSFKKKPDGRYANWCVDLMWDVWQARAARAQGVKG